MGRNGKSVPAFAKMVEFVNANVGKTVNSNEMLLGKEPGRNTETAYLYKFIRLGYVKAVNDGPVMHKDTCYEIIRPFSPHCNSVVFMNELREAKGLIPENYKYKKYTNYEKD